MLMISENSLFTLKQAYFLSMTERHILASLFDITARWCDTILIASLFRQVLKNGYDFHHYRLHELLLAVSNNINYWMFWERFSRTRYDFTALRAMLASAAPQIWALVSALYVLFHWLAANFNSSLVLCPRCAHFPISAEMGLMLLGIDRAAITLCQLKITRQLVYHQPGHFFRYFILLCPRSPKLGFKAASARTTHAALKKPKAYLMIRPPNGQTKLHQSLPRRHDIFVIYHAWLIVSQALFAPAATMFATWYSFRMVRQPGNRHAFDCFYYVNMRWLII